MQIVVNGLMDHQDNLNIYSQQSGFRQGVSKRVEGVYTQYMIDDESAYNTAENSSAKSILKSSGSYYTNVLMRLGFEESNPPVADLLRQYHHLEGEWIIASPIHWEATHNDAMITSVGSALSLNQEAHALYLKVADFLNHYGFESFYHDPTTWLFRIDNQPSIQTSSIYFLLHQSIQSTLMQLDSSLFWQRLITELQMLFSAPLEYQLNENERVNGVWFWGNGLFQSNFSFDIFTDDEVLLNLTSPQLSIQPFSTDLDFKKNCLICIKYPEKLELSWLEDKVKKNKVDWYWNNVAYSQASSQWWSRLWRK